MLLALVTLSCATPSTALLVKHANNVGDAALEPDTSPPPTPSPALPLPRTTTTTTRTVRTFLRAVAAVTHREVLHKTSHASSPLYDSSKVVELMW
jgi:hypothetical protein